MAQNPYDKYREQSIMTMTHGEMLIKLFDEALRQMKGAVTFIEESDMPSANKALQKAQKIINYLRSTLDFKYEISNNLASLYDFFVRQMITANVRKDPKMIKEIIPMVSELRDAFAQGDKLARMEKQPPTSSAMRIG